MTITQCDQCKQEINPYSSGHHIQLEGVGPSSGIMLPEGCFHHDFCSHRCLYEWLAANRSDFPKHVKGVD